MSGRIGPMLASGVCEQDFETLAAQRSSDMLRHTFGLPPESRTMIIDEFARARSRIGLLLQSKFGVFQSLPLNLLGLGHVDEVVARSMAVRIVRDMEALAEPDKSHGQVRFFFGHLQVLRSFAEGRIRRAQLPQECQQRIQLFALVQANESSIEGKPTYF